MDKTLTNHEIEKIAGTRVPVLTHHMLNKYRTIEEVFQGSTAVMLLYEYEDKMGHWTCLIKHPDSIEFFDPYGEKPDQQKAYIPKNRWTINKLSHLLYDAATRGWTIEYNEVKLQSLAKGINTCGRWIAIRIRYRSIDLNSFQKIFQELSKPKDQAIVKISNQFL